MKKIVEYVQPVDHIYNLVLDFGEDATEEDVNKCLDEIVLKTSFDKYGTLREVVDVIKNEFGDRVKIDENSRLEYEFQQKMIYYNDDFDIDEKEKEEEE